MTVVNSHKEYFEAGLQVLTEMGYGGLKLAEVCKRLGVTTGSFYHHFSSWPAYTRDLAQYWVDTRTVNRSATLRAEPDPHQRVVQLAEGGMELPHETESAIRAWSLVDAEVRELLAAVDRERFEVLSETAFEILRDTQLAQRFASWASYLRIGYQQALLPRDPDTLRWVFDQLIDVLYSQSSAGVPAGGTLVE